MEKLVSLLNMISEVAPMKKDPNATWDDARELSIAPLVHEHGKFNGWDKHDTVEALDELNGYDEAIEGQCKVMNGCQCDDASGRAAASLLGRRWRGAGDETPQA